MQFGHLMLCDQRDGISSQVRYEQMMEEVRLMDRLGHTPWRRHYGVWPRLRLRQRRARDGYGNSRVMKFASNGKFLTTWGTPGKGRGEFDLPHTIVVDAKGRVIVGDRENDHIQVFDSEGKLLEVWSGFAPFGIDLNPEGVLFVADGRTRARGQGRRILEAPARKQPAVYEVRRTPSAQERRKDRAHLLPFS